MKLKPNFVQKTHLLGAALTVMVTLLQAQEPEITETETPENIPILEGYVVTPAKFPQISSEVGSTISLITGQTIETSQIYSFEDAIKLSPGVIVASTGQKGSVSSVFMRGVNSNQVQLVIDGVRINDSNIDSNLFLGSGVSHNMSRIEVLRGPQSALYGGEAVGGVISLWSPKGYGDPGSEIEFYGGSFGTFGTQFSSLGAEGPSSYSVSVGWESTENDRLVNNDFEDLYYAARLDHAMSDVTTVGVTIRGANREYGAPGDIFTNDPDDSNRETFNLLTGYLDHQVNDLWNTHLLAGWLYQNYEDIQRFGGLAPDMITEINNDKAVLDWRNTFTLPAGHTSLFGIGYEHTNVTNNGFSDIDEADSLISLYFEQLLQVTDDLALTGGVRWEDYSSFGEALTWRGTGSYHLDETATTFRASVGSGFRAPSFFELYGQNFFYTGNPELEAEGSVGWDVGVDQEVGDLGIFGVTWFHNDLDQLITGDFAVFPSTVVNLDEAFTQGLEVDWRGTINNTLNYRLAYTYLEAENAVTGARLLRRPEHTLSFDVNTLLADRLRLGMGGYWIQNRLDVDPLTFATIDGDDYFLARFYGSLEVTKNVELNLRVENAFDEDYVEVEGFPGRGLGVFGGAKIRF